MHAEFTRESKTCLRCADTMSFLGLDSFQKGRAGLLFGNLDNIFSGTMQVAVYVCKSCRYLEFCLVGDEVRVSDLPQVKCPKCGNTHDFDYPYCPVCRYTY